MPADRMKPALAYYSDPSARASRRRAARSSCSTSISPTRLYDKGYYYMLVPRETVEAVGGTGDDIARRSSVHHPPRFAVDGRERGRGSASKVVRDRLLRDLADPAAASAQRVDAGTPAPSLQSSTGRRARAATERPAPAACRRRACAARARAPSAGDANLSGKNSRANAEAATRHELPDAGRDQWNW